MRAPDALGGLKKTKAMAERARPEGPRQPSAIPHQRNRGEVSIPILVAFLTVIGCVATTAVILATPHGIGFGYDSVFYWSAAQNLVAGNGLLRMGGAGQLEALTHFPPLYSVLLAGTAWLSGLTIVESARWSSAVLLGLSTVTVGVIVWRATNSTLASGLSSFFLLVSPFLIERHLWAMSEGLYVLLALTSIALLVEAVFSSGWRWTALAGLAAGLVPLARYAGITIVGAGVLILLLSPSSSEHRRRFRATLYAILGAAPVLLWQIRNQQVGGSLTNRVLAFHPVDLGQIRFGASTIASWIPYPSIPAEIRASMVAVLALAAFGLVATRGQPANWPSEGRHLRAAWLAGIAALHGAIYGVFLIASLSFFDASTRLDNRILSPLYLDALLITAGLLGPLARTRSRTKVAAVAMLLLLGLGVPYANQTRTLLTRSSREGFGFHSRAWRQSETVRQVVALDLEGPIYSNEAFPIYFLTGIPTRWVPEVVDPVQGSLRQDYQNQLKEMQSELRNGGVLVLFHPDALRPELPSLETITDGLALDAQFADGSIYRSEVPR